MRNLSRQEAILLGVLCQFGRGGEQVESIFGYQNNERVGAEYIQNTYSLRNLCLD